MQQAIIMEKQWWILGRIRSLLKQVEANGENDPVSPVLHRGFVATVLSSFLVFSLLTMITVRSIRPPVVPPRAAMGKIVWQKGGCVQCHSLFGNGAYNAVDLTRETEVRSREWLRRFFQEPPLMRPGGKKRHPPLSGSEADLLVDYLEFVSSINTLGWPPRPATGRAASE